jgi:hypothetical protein
MTSPRRTFPPGPGDSHDDAAWLGGEVMDDWLEARNESEDPNGDEEGDADSDVGSVEDHLGW